MSLILAIETSTVVSSIALASEGEIIAERFTAQGRGHVEFLMPAIVELFEECDLAISDLGLVAVGLGPGLFTGMRVGIATAKTIAQMRGIEVVGVGSLDNLAWQARAEERLVVPCIDARRAEVFFALARNGTLATEPANTAPRSLAESIEAQGEPALFVGDGAVAYASELAVAGDVREGAPDAATCAVIALAGALSTPPALVEPLYVRRSEAEIKWEGRGVTPERPARVQIPGPRSR